MLNILRMHLSGLALNAYCFVAYVGVDYDKEN